MNTNTERYKRIERVLEEKGLKPYDICKNTGISSATMTDWKQGKYTPKIDKLILIADYLGMNLMDIYEVTP